MVGSALLLMSALFLGGTTFGTPTHAGFSECTTTWNYAGWSSIKYAFIFGDSYTETGFNDTGIQPTIGNPLGNPVYPGYTSSNGPNWVDFLTVKYNESKLLTYNFAYGGATVDSTIVALIVQLYYHSPVIVPWNSSDTLFGVFIGINDVGNSYKLGVAATKVLNNKIFAVYKSLMEMLYNIGAKNFLFLNVPPMDRSPGANVQRPALQALQKADIKAFNDMIGDLADQLKDAHNDINIFTVDANGLFTTVLNNPSLFPQTAGYKNMTTYCVAYENGTLTEGYFNPSCGIPVNEYFWLNTVHPTYPMQDVLGLEVAKTLRAGPNVC